MKNLLLVLLLTCAMAAFAQQTKVFDWVRASDEAVQLDPAEYHSGRVYRPAADGGNIHVAIKAAQPVTVAMTWAAEWNYAREHPEALPRLQFRCVREHVVSTMYECHLPPGEPMVLTIRDERGPDRAVSTSVGAIFRGGRAVRQLIAPNDLLITYHSWSCVENCIQPEFQWVRLVKEKYELTSMTKVYTVLTPERDGQQVHVNIKAAVPMMVAVVPAEFADQVYGNPETIASALGKSSCKQRGVQKLNFDCKFNVADGAQALIIRPESSNVPNKKKAEIELQVIKCVANCELLAN